jgi:hypothetical protein
MTFKINKMQVIFYPRIITVLFGIVSIGYNKVRLSLLFFFWNGRISLVSVLL